MIKIWLVTFSNGEEWHICGEYRYVLWAAINYAVQESLAIDPSKIKYLRWVPVTSFAEGQV